jgi:structural maintenance of chromosomes protein 5
VRSFARLALTVVSNSVDRRLKGLEDQKKQRYARMTDFNNPKTRNIADTNFMKALSWLYENKHNFRSFVEPACFSMDVVDPKFAYAIEGCISIMQMKTFIFEYEEDYKKFNEYFDGKPFGERYTPFSWYRPKEGPSNLLPRPDKSTEEIRAAGFNGYASDLVRAPPAVMWFLKRQCDFHRIVSINICFSLQ